MSEDEIINALSQWKHQEPLHIDGVITGCDKRVEFLLPWWWKNYSAHNSYPVVFLNFGMTETAISWCKKRGDVVDIEIPQGIIADGRGQIDPEALEKWERFKKWKWDKHRIFFTKAVSLLSTKFKRTLWLDIDCEVLGNLALLFEHCVPPYELVVNESRKTKDERRRLIGGLKEGDELYNTGVLVFFHGSPSIQKWIEGWLKYNKYYFGDQDILSKILNRKQYPFKVISREIYNAHRKLVPLTDKVLIRHWMGDGIRLIIKKMLYWNFERDDI